MKNPIKICHLTTVHKRYDIRIFVKECSSLAKIKNFSVNLIVADGNGEEIKNNVKVYDIGKPKGRLNRFYNASKLIYKKAKELNFDIYHIHDPELLPIGLKLKKLGKKVIFDAHEDFPMQILSKHYLPKTIKPFLSKILSSYEKRVAKKLDGIVTATPFIRRKFESYKGSNVVDIKNFPLNEEIIINPKNIQEKKDNSICYVGGISEARGIYELVESLKLIKDVNLELAGGFVSNEFHEKTKTSLGWQKVNYHGFVNRDEVLKIFKKSKIGMVTLYKTPNIINSLPIKLFEYMAAGLPVIISNIPYWEEFVIGSCGISVNPKSPDEISKAINYLIENKDEAKKMGENGRKAVMEKYNWAIEEERLIKFYKELA